LKVAVERSIENAFLDYKYSSKVIHKNAHFIVHCKKYGNIEQLSKLGKTTNKQTNKLIGRKKELKEPDQPINQRTNQPTNE